MKFQGTINKNQQGVTLLEIVIALAIAGIITGVTTQSIFQIIKNNALASNRIAAITDVQSAGYWLGRDTLMAKTVTVNQTAPTGFPLILKWTNSESVAYSLEDSKLQRRYSKNNDPTQILTVAQYINSDNTSYRYDSANNTATASLTASVGAGSQRRSETRVYTLMPRLGLHQ